MRLFFFLVITVFRLSGGAENVCTLRSNAVPCFPDYYWRDYKGHIPEDAVEGGKSPSGESFYIGQAFFEDNELLPATIFPQDPYVTASAYGKEIKTNTHVKILCSKQKSNIKWVWIESENLHRLTNNVHILIGGSQKGHVLYIGRVFDDVSITLGKIFKHSLDYRGIWVPSNGSEAHYLSYDILTYSCEHHSVSVY